MRLLSFGGRALAVRAPFSAFISELRTLNKQVSPFELPAVLPLAIVVARPPSPSCSRSSSNASANGTTDRASRIALPGMCRRYWTSGFAFRAAAPSPECLRAARAEPTPSPSGQPRRATVTSSRWTTDARAHSSRADAPSARLARRAEPLGQPRRGGRRVRGGGRRRAARRRRRGRGAARQGSVEESMLQVDIIIRATVARRGEARPTPSLMRAASSRRRAKRTCACAPRSSSLHRASVRTPHEEWRRRGRRDTLSSDNVVSQTRPQLASARGGGAHARIHVV